MKSGICKKLILAVLTVGLLFFSTLLSASAQDNFREFDRNNVVTPAELFNALSTFQPPGQRKQISSERQEKINNAWRKVLDNLSPEEQQQAWEFAEKYVRENGVESTSSKKLMNDFGVPPEMQNELAKALRKFGTPSTNADSSSDKAPDDALSRLFRKARNEMNPESRSEGNSPDRVAEPRNSGRPTPDRNTKRDQQKERPTQKNPRPSNTNEGQQKPGRSNQEGQQNDSTSEPNSNSSSDNGRNQDPANTQPPRTLPSNGRIPNANRNRDPRRNRERIEEKAGVTSDTELEQLLKRMGDLKSENESNGGTEGRQGSADPAAPKLDMEKIIKELAEAGDDGNPFSKSDTNGILEVLKRARANRPGEKALPLDDLDPSLLKRAQDLISGSRNRESNSEDGGWGRVSANGASSTEKVGTRFDRLLMKAAERTLKSNGDSEGVSGGVDSVFESLIERIQKQASKKKDDRERSSRNSSDRNRGGRRQDRAASGNRTASNGNDAAERILRTERNPEPRADDAPTPSTPNSSTSSFDPQKMLGSIPDLSAINPAHVFIFFAIAGFILFAGYFLTQTVVGNESTVRKRKAIKQIRNTKIKSPKDLVETVDMFLLTKFGIKSSWWNARVAQTVMNSGSPELKTRVDELIRDYVRARYMRDDIQIPEADQQRYKKTLEELSVLDIKPEADLRLAATSPVAGSPAPAEG